MKIRRLDENGDWVFGEGLSSYLKDGNAIKLHIKTRLLEWIDDCFFALDAGVDWQNRLDKGQAVLLESEIRRVILRTLNVVSLETISITIIDRKFRVDYTVKTIYSTSIRDIIEI